MRYDFSEVEDVQSFVSIPQGAYDCRIAEVREGVSRDGSVRWSFRLEVLDGQYAGRTAGWDSLTWSERAIHRVKRILAILGFDTDGVVEIQASDLVGLELRALFESEEREDPHTGVRVQRLSVPYDGYAPLENGNDTGPEREGEGGKLVDARLDGMGAA